MNCTLHLTKAVLKRYKSTVVRTKSIASEQDVSSTQKKAEPKISPSAKKSHSARINHFFQNNPRLKAVKNFIPEKYLALKRITPPENLYLIDEQVAQKAASYILPDIRENENQIICETNAGLGFISEHLLNNGIKLVRLYESCPDFKIYLKSHFELYRGRVELFTKDIFLLQRYEYIDKQDHGNRVEQLMKGVPKKKWEDDPVMTIIGTLPNNRFIHFLIKCLMLQSFVMSFGRIQLYVFMRPKDYVIFTAGPHLNLHTYQRWSVLFDLCLECKLLEKFPREIFLPWHSPKTLQIQRYPDKVDPDKMYLVKINFKKELPVANEDLLPLYTFIDQFFGKGNNKIVPILEKWVPSSGLDILVPKLNHKNYFNDINIFTKFGELTPQEILSVFEEMITHPEYKKSHFMSIIESHLIKSETIESSLDEHLEKNIVKNIEDKFD